MPKLANRPAANASRDRVEGLRQSHIEKLSELIRRGDPRLWHNFAGVSESKRRRLEETSPMVRQAARQLDALLAGEPVVVPAPRADHIDWLRVDPDDIDATLARPRLVTLHVDDTVEPVAD
jgi:hypothetical protein